MSKQKFHILASKVHKWIGLILGIQLLFWVSGGFVMSWFHINQVRGDHLVSIEAPGRIDVADYSLPSLKAELAEYAEETTSIALDQLMGQPVFKVTLTDGKVVYFDAATGHALPQLGADEIRAIASGFYVGDGPLASVEFLEETEVEYRGSLPVWRADFSDSQNTSLYIHPETGQLLSTRTDLWRFYDFMWMLHIMDYDTRDDFNNPLLYTTAFAALFFVISGFVLLYFRFHRKDFNFIMGKRAPRSARKK
ncbi:hypothetical protein GCM10017044_01550 [Kordiimonas sediminis]|uniref:PepSY domain-containing protein n=1 Tax=Kordiimonas sediminis TaxID=1735581 RepID=A0A919E3Y6_9PROT|nr:PepSY domain-containing protein [Kordiimonas sediminis]GHF11475.1 hypothetical protein GCM10017044_01550 [Kordiimonas sediminis]